jgi:hypothetical protein
MSDDDLPELTPEQIAAFHRAAATLKDEDFSPEELAGIRKGFLQLTKDKAHEGKIWYEQPKIRNLPERGSFRLGRDVLAALGHGDLQAGGRVAAHMFSVEPGDDPTIISADVVRDVGHGDLAKGHKVLGRFVSMLRRQSREGVTLVHDGLQHEDGHHGWSVRR